ncbi:family 20 glycosylhydrolase [Mucilaginibacter paludis]|uniref:beta-N-acetylhexosaminidase n=1 Tax=Mucilaginibacter paludis DSM 18603 TaxID=714943 RepID=H1YGH6_9SPHI|nr:family 20 glycosylhydrolase [Mucilaginibacter paludis]EHQ24528.1 Glycoside hydrolase, family 20, catalytic core [Mucilaginibacter paludis DSM 18603]
MIKYFLLLIFTTSTVIATAQDANPNLNIIPAPVSIKKATGTFSLSMETAIQADTPSNKAVTFLASYLTNNWGYHKISTIDNSVNTNVVKLTSVGAENLPEGGYHLSITPDHITIAGKGAGLFYGIQTLIQLMPTERAGVAKLPCVEIDDYPRLGYRGLHLDVSRHFFSIDFVKKYIDLMAAYKLNNFHWHLTDDQGWRIEIKKYPRLTQVGSQRSRTMIGNYHDHFPLQYDNTPYGGFYTQDQIREVVKYAADRYINVVPEIDMPGHSEAAVAAYPELSCEPTRTYKVGETWGGFPDIYCPTEYTFTFLENVLTEVMALFPSKLIHVGGDEVAKDAWRKSKFCQKLIKKLKLKNEEGLQSYFIQRIEKFVNSKGRTIIGWDEILQGGLAPNATVMSWTGESGGITAAQQHHNVIMTPGNYLYFDHAQGKSNLEPLSIGGYLSLQKTYNYNPVPVVLDPSDQKYIIGVQANIWTEYIATEYKLEYMLLPRLFALAEIAWTPLANKNYIDFAETRVPVHLAKIDAAGLNYRVATASGVVDTIMTGNTFRFELKSPVAGAKIYYTIDGYTPRETDLEYKTPLNILVPDSASRELKTIVIAPSGKRSAVTHTIMNNMPPLPAVNFTGTAAGFKYKVFAGKFTGVDQLDDARLVDTGIIKNFGTSAFRKNNRYFGVIYNGYIRIDNEGKYLFSTISADGSTVLIDDDLVVDNDGKHSTFEHGGEVLLQKGFHKITVKYFFAGAANTLRVYMAMPGRPKTDLPPDIIFN